MPIPFASLGTQPSLRLAPPTFKPAGGDGYTFPLNVTISVQSPAKQLRYTINDANINATTGTLVTEASVVIALASGDTLRAIAIDSNGSGSVIQKDTYHDGAHPGGGANPPGVYP